MADSQSTSARATFHLPIEITLDILSRLPVKCLLRCKSVCKTWYALIESPNFIANHIQTQSSLIPTSLLTTIYNLGNPYLLTQNYYMSLVNDGVNNGPIHLDFPFLKSRNYLPISEMDYLPFWEGNYFSVGGICNGLVCIILSLYGHPLICNPSTGQFREIQRDEWMMSWDVFVQWLSFGFGFHPSANDYKLITIVAYSTPLRNYSIRVDLYAMSTDTWRQIRETNVYEEWNELVQICGSSAAAVLNGVFYWPVHLLETDQVGVMSFNMGDEVFRKIRIPEGLDIIWDQSNWRFTFTELYDKLALVVVSPDQTGFRVWVLNENETSWTNQVNVDAFPMIATGMRSGEVGKITVAGGGKNGELFVIAHKESGDLKLFAYDPKTRETKDLCSCQVPYASCVYLYTGTLLSVMQANEVVLVYKNKKMKH